MPTILALLTPDYADWEFAMVAAAARGYCGVNVITASPEGEPVTSMGGLRAVPDTAFNDIDLGKVSALLVIGGTAWESPDAPDIGELLRAANWDQRLIAAICGGTRALAASGLLDRVQHTSNAKSYIADVTGYRGADFYRDVPTALRAGNIITAPGTAPVSFMKTVIEALRKGSAELDFYAGMFGAEHEANRRAA
ncbi:MAG: glutamine amidotransferase [Rhizobium sp.]|nr:glutamine amidotransferase [Rhizobium sp.]